MPAQSEKIEAFRNLHQAGNPLILMNVWDAGSAGWLSKTPLAALATGSYALAGALGYEDGECAPRDEILSVLHRICRAAGDTPVSHDAERGYAPNAVGVADYVREIASAGAVGINLEDSLAGCELRAAAEQCERLAAAKSALGDGFLNARCDIFFGAVSASDDEKLQILLERAADYRRAGADGLFVPGLLDLSLLETVCQESQLPVNVMRPLDGPAIPAIAGAGVSRISHGPFAWLAAGEVVKSAAAQI